MTGRGPVGSVWLSAGERAFHRGGISEAHGLFCRAACADPTSGVACRNAGASAAVLQDLDAACKYFTWLCRLEPGTDLPPLELGKARLLLGDYPASAEALSLSISLAPAAPTTMIYYSSALRRIASLDVDVPPDLVPVGSRD